MAINWDSSKEDTDLIMKIVARAAETFKGEINRMELSMDLTAVHLNDTPLDLAAFLDGAPFDFAHDIAGIVRHLNRTTGKLGGCFSPRFTLKAKKELGEAVNRRAETGW